MARPPKRQPGEPRRGPLPWEPTPDERRMVEHYAAIGYTQEQIAALLNKSVDSLQRYCRRELDLGSLTVNGKIGGKLYQKAMAGDTAALIFWAKTRMGWKETDRREVVLPGDAMDDTAIAVRAAALVAAALARDEP